MHRYRLLPPLHPEVRRTAPLEQRLVYALLRVLAGVGFILHALFCIFGGDGLSAFASSYLTAFGALPLHALYGILYILGCVLPFIELLVGLTLLSGFFTRYALLTGYFLLLSTLIHVILDRAWRLAEQLPFYFAAISLLLIGRHRFDEPWNRVFRKSP
jgi:uncharacterized membrane protein YphA (DoxX/SURF4 family)